MSSVMPRSWPTTMPWVMTSTWHPRSASTSAVEVAWWKPISSMTTTSPNGCTEPSSTSRTSTTFVGVARHPVRAERPRRRWRRPRGRAASPRPGRGHTPTPYSNSTPEAPALGELVADQVAELGPVGHRRGQAHLPAATCAPSRRRSPGGRCAPRRSPPGARPARRRRPARDFGFDVRRTVPTPSRLAARCGGSRCNRASG